VSELMFEGVDFFLKLLLNVLSHAFANYKPWDL
jgi:hypothetical protein